MKPLELIEQGRFLGEEFLVWLWWQGQAAGGVSGEDGDQSALFVDDRLVVVSERGDVKELSLCKGNPAESREAFEALSRGMRPAKLKVRLLSGDMEWIATLDAATLRFSSLKMPPTQAKDLQGRLADRIFLLEEAFGHLDRRYRAFLAHRYRDPDDLETTLRSWVQDCLEGPLEEDQAHYQVQCDHDATTDPSVRKSLGRLFNTLAGAGAGITIETSGEKVEISPEDASRAALRLGDGA
jgi:hypothetical protein